MANSVTAKNAWCEAHGVRSCSLCALNFALLTLRPSLCAMRFALCSLRLYLPNHPGGVSRNDRVRRDVFCHDAPRTDNGVLADGDVAEDRGPGPDRRAFFHDCRDHLPVGLALQGS